jgi:cation:H+ antiporter
VLGVSAVIKPLPLQSANNLDIGMVILASVLLFVTMFSGDKRLLDRWEGAVFLVVYAGYILYLAMFSGPI